MAKFTWDADKGVNFDAADGEELTPEIAATALLADVVQCLADLEETLKETRDALYEIRNAIIGSKQ